ncbi:MAG: VWA domain-containing protein [Myxococcales bacterium FL481]|nr:MAG: VWA domain-containing protein [Myxococcales bacterium FL481]
MRWRSLLRTVMLPVISLGVTVGASTPQARADTLWTTRAADGTNYMPIEELSYEIIVDRNDGHDATVRQRVAIHNAGQQRQDFVLTLVTPRACELRGMAVNRDGRWHAGDIVDDAGKAATRPSGVVLARTVPAAKTGPRAAEIVGFGLEAGTTVQVELLYRAFPVMHGDRWKLDLPRREIRSPNMVRERRVIVRGLNNGESFYIDDGPNLGSPFMSTRAEDSVTVAWPAPTRRGKLLDGHADAVAYSNDDGGKLHVYLRLGSSKPSKPDHVVLLIDRSRSTSPQLGSRVPGVLDALARKLGDQGTVWAATFARDVAPLFDQPLPLAAPGTRAQLKTALQADDRAQGTSLVAALAHAEAHLATTRARRPLIVVVTDGLVPRAASLDGWRQRLAKQRADTLFLVDDAILARFGIEPTHPIIDAAGQLGARVSVTSLEGMRPDAGDVLLGAPRVMGDLSFAVGPRAQLHGEVPAGLVAGGIVRLEGTYTGKAPRTITVRGRAGDKRVVGRLRVRGRDQLPAALGVATGRSTDLDGGFVLPTDYHPADRSEALAAVAQSGRGGFEARGRLDQTLIQRYLRTRVRPRARVCYNQALSRIKDVSGRAQFEFELGKGEVMWASLDSQGLNGADTRFLECLSNAMWSLEIPAGKLDSGTYRVRYPIAFTLTEDRERYELTDDDKVLIDVLLRRANVYAR